jgi:hypothetical protein
LSNDGNRLASYKTIDFVNSEMLICIFDDFASKISKETIVILDNAPTHRSKLFSSKIENWSNLGLKLLFLPPYSPQLNKIETLQISKIIIPLSLLFKLPNVFCF